jgi:methylated-DNA-protein-cysteine methyltransferase-like protein
VLALKFLPPNTNPPIPWHRVIGASGTISSRGPGTDGAQRQRDALVAEGVDVTTGRTGELRVDFGQYGWFPSIDAIRIQHPQNQERRESAEEERTEESELDA